MKVLAAASSLALLVAMPVLAQPTSEMAGMKGMEHVAPVTGPHGVGVIKKLDAAGGSVTLQHGPIAALNWPAMTMTFKADPSVLQSVKPGEKVEFVLKPGSSPEVVSIKPAS